MKITYIKLKNVAGIYVGSNKYEIEIDFSKSTNKIVAIIAKNGSGKSVLLSSLSPFALQTAVDDRSTLSYILQHKDGYKEIHYQNGKDEYIIKHYYKAMKESHSIKSYFMKNGEELNENGNVTSFNSLVEINFGLTQEMMRLIRIGTNVNSFITLTPARRKEYIGKLIDEIDMYMKIYKKVNEDIRVIKTLIQTNNNNLYASHIQDPIIEQDKLSSLEKDIEKCEAKRDEIIAKLSKVKSLIDDNNIHDLRRKKEEAVASYNELVSIESKLKDKNLLNITMDDLMKLRSKHSDEKVSVQSKINSYKLTIDSLLKSIERIEMNINKITSDNDVKSLISIIEELKSSIEKTPDIVKKYKPNMTSDQIRNILNKLEAFNQTTKMIYTLGDKPLSLYMKLHNDDVDIDAWLKEKSEQLASKVSASSVEKLIDKIYEEYTIVSPICSSDQFESCPYYRFHEIIGDERKKNEDDIDNETLHYISIISKNIDEMLNEMDVLRETKLPDKIRSQFKEKTIMERLRLHLQAFDLVDIQALLTLVNDWEIYKKSFDMLIHYENQFTLYKKSGIENQIREIDSQKKQIQHYRDEIIALNSTNESLSKKLEDIDDDITIVSKYNDGKKYKKIFEATIESTTKILEPLESASEEKLELEYELRTLTNAITETREKHHQLEVKLNEYNKLVDEGKKLSKKYRDLNIIQETVSTKKGIPVYYMKRYLTKIQQFANDLLSIIYEDEFTLASFNVTTDTFEVPYIKNGKKIPDIKYASQSEVALATMALSFSLANNASTIYNILLLDEIDGGLDNVNRGAFLKMLYSQMEKLHAEQVFIISHNLSQMTNVPMDCIMMSDVEKVSKLQNVIYEN